MSVVMLRSRMSSHACPYSAVPIGERCAPAQAPPMDSMCRGSLDIHSYTPGATSASVHPDFQSPAPHAAVSEPDRRGDVIQVMPLVALPHLVERIMLRLSLR